MALERFANTPTPAAPSTPWTTLNGAITSGALSLTVASASAFPSLAQFRVLIDSEWMLVTAGAGTTTWTVTRGVEGSTPTAHAHGASIFHVLTAAAFLRNPRSMTTLGDMEYMAADLGPARLAAPSDGDYVTRWTAGVPSWVVAGGGGGTPGGSDTQIQYNDGGAFGGSATLVYDPATVGLGILQIPIASLETELQAYHFAGAAAYVVVTDCAANDTPWIGQLTLAQQVNDNADVVGGYSATMIRQGTVGVTQGTLIGYAADCFIDTANPNPSVQVAFEANFYVKGSSASTKVASYYSGITHEGPGALGRATAFYAPVPANIGGGTIDEYVALKVSDFSGVAGVTGKVIEYGTKFIVDSDGSVVSTGTITGSNLSGTNTGDQTSVSGNAGTATALQTARLINGVSFDGTSDITISGGSGDVVGPASSVDNSIVRFDSTTGKLVQGYTSGAPTIDDTGHFLAANGSAAAPIYSSTSFPTTGFYFGSATSIRIAHNGSQTATIGSAGWEIISSGAQISLGTDANGVNLKRNGSGIVEFQGATSTNPQTVRLYETFTDASNHSRIVLRAVAAADYELFPEANGSGTLRGLKFGTSAGRLGFFGTTAVARAAAYTPTNVTTDRSYDANATTIDEVADVLGTLIADLQAYGLLQ